MPTDIEKLVMGEMKVRPPTREELHKTLARAMRQNGGAVFQDAIDNVILVLKAVIDSLPDAAREERER